MLKPVLAIALLAAVGNAQNAPLLDILAGELERNFAVLKAKADPPAYFMAYTVVEQRSEVFSAAFGALQARNSTHNRVLDVSVRVGSRALDNYRSSRGERPQFSAAVLLPIEDKPDDIRRKLWMETDRTLRRATQRLINLRTSTQVSVSPDDQIADFSEEAPVTHVSSAPALRVDGEQWAAKVRRWSAGFRKYPEILASDVSVRLASETRYFVNTEGTRVQQGRQFARIAIVARAKAADGMDLFAMDSFDASTPDGLPGDAAVAAAVERTAKRLQGLLEAPVVEPFVGPAILSGRASAVFFHEIFGHRIEGHRQKDEGEGQTFTKRVNEPVLPEFLSVVLDPTRAKAAGTDLNGTYLYDDEGVKARPVTVVDQGVLKTFLLSRSPVRGFPNSNGHGRKQPGAEVVARQSNLIVESSKRMSDKELRAMLLAELKRQNKPFGLFFAEVTGGFTTTSRASLQAFTVIPIVVYKVYADGRPDELVRGVDIVGTPLASFAKIVATGDKPEVFNGYCGAESGSVPVAAVSPAILVSEIEIQKKDARRDRPPLLPPPTDAGGAL